MISVNPWIDLKIEYPRTLHLRKDHQKADQDINFF